MSNFEFKQIEVDDLLESCPICGDSKFSQIQVIWPELVQEWELSPEQTKSMNYQQGYSCNSCGCNLRSMTLGSAICRAMDYVGTLQELSKSAVLWKQNAVLEMNGAGNLTPFLSTAIGHRLTNYPEVDMQDMHSIPENSYDLVTHSDTLEHVPNSMSALRECFKVLKPGGILAYTVPILVDRMTRSRESLPPSYHLGGNAPADESLRVHREYGTDAWCELMSAGFQQVAFHSICFPHGVALIGIK